MTPLKLKILRAIRDESGETRRPVMINMVAIACNVAGSAERRQIGQYCQQMERAGLVVVEGNSVRLTADGKAMADSPHIDPDKEKAAGEAMQRAGIAPSGVGRTRPDHPWKKQNAASVAECLAKRDAYDGTYIENHCDECGEYESECECADETPPPASAAQYGMVGTLEDMLAVTVYAAEHATERLRELKLADPTPAVIAELASVREMGLAIARQWDELEREVRRGTT